MPMLAMPPSMYIWKTGDIGDDFVFIFRVPNLMNLLFLEKEGIIQKVSCKVNFLHCMDDKDSSLWLF